MQFYCFGSEKGTSLIEVLIGVLILVMVTLVTSSIVATTFKSAVKSRVLKEVKQNGDYALTVMGRAIINAAELVENTDGDRCTGTMTKLNVKNADGITFTEFALAGGAITQSDGSTTTNITSSQNVVVSNLSFDCVSSPTKPEYITVSFNVQQSGTPISTEQIASLDFQSTFTVRN